MDVLPRLFLGLAILVFQPKCIARVMSDNEIRVSLQKINREKTAVRRMFDEIVVPPDPRLS